MNVSYECHVHGCFVVLLLARAAWAEPPTAKPEAKAGGVAHSDPIKVDNNLTLPKLVDATLEKYPDVTWLKSLEEEAEAIKERGQSWTAGAYQAGLRYQNMTSGTVHYADAMVQIPLWNIGQRDAEQKYGLQSRVSAEDQVSATKLRVAGLVRGALWDMALQQVRFDQARVDADIFEKLLAKVERRVELVICRKPMFCCANRIAAKSLGVD